MKKRSYLLILSLTLITLGVLTYLYTLDPRIVDANIFLSTYLQAKLHSFVPFLQVISTAEYFIIPAFYIFPVYFLLKKQRLLAGITFAAASSWIVGRLLKEFFLGPCPGINVVDHLYPVFGNLESFFRAQCFPSGHVFDYISILGMTFFINTKVLKKHKVDPLTNGLIIFLIATVGVSRVVLGAHWTTDVLAGYMFGGAWLMLLIYFYRQLSEN